MYYTPEQLKRKAKGLCIDCGERLFPYERKCYARCSVCCDLRRYDPAAWEERKRAFMEREDAEKRARMKNNSRGLSCVRCVWSTGCGEGYWFCPLPDCQHMNPQADPRPDNPLHTTITEVMSC